jgi:hypothetical protein
MTASHRIMLEHVADAWERIALDIDNLSVPAQTENGLP